MRKLVAIVLVALASALLLPPGARADDVVEKTDGAKLRGTVILDSPECVKIKTSGGVITIPREEVARVERAKDIFKEYTDREAALEKDANAPSTKWLELARWCQEK